MRAEIGEAHAFGKWLGGLLPSVEQWDRAAGRFDAKEDDEGPFIKDWKDTPGAEDIAVGRAELGPLPVGAAKKDRSRLGCHDMAGNGFEWTRTFVTGGAPGEFIGDSVRVPTDARVLLRGRDYAHPNPLFFKELLEPYITFDFFEASRAQAIRPYLAHIGFRVVIEVD
jgi:formylglycine-generating enzyme required for sulfatase activity